MGLQHHHIDWYPLDYQPASSGLPMVGLVRIGSHPFVHGGGRRWCGPMNWPRTSSSLLARRC